MKNIEKALLICAFIIVVATSIWFVHFVWTCEGTVVRDLWGMYMCLENK